MRFSKNFIVNINILLIKSWKTSVPVTMLNYNQYDNISFLFCISIKTIQYISIEMGSMANRCGVKNV